MSENATQTVEYEALLAELATLRAVNEKLEHMLGQQERQRELIEEAGPILKQVMGVATERLDDMERRGYFAAGRASVGVVERVVESYSAQEIEQFGDQIVAILDTVRNATQSDVLVLLNESLRAMRKAPKTKPLGLRGLFRLASHPDTRRGMTIALEVLRHIGRTAEELSQSQPSISARLAPTSRQLPATVAPAPTRTVSRPARQIVTPQECDIPATSASDDAFPDTLGGLPLTPDGYLADPSTWTEDWARAMAGHVGVTLTDRHMHLLTKSREDYAERGKSPNLRRLTLIASVDTREVYALFPDKPGPTIARCAGIPKPGGCI